MSGGVELVGGELVSHRKGPVVRACPGGPWLVRGADHVVTEDGVEHPTTRPVVAVCACARSQRAPWCDGTHKVLKAAARR